MENGFTREVLT